MSKLSSPTGPELISPPSTPGYPTPATSWTASTSSAGSQQGSPRMRRDIQRRPDGTLPAFDPDVFRARFALLRRGDQLSDAQAAHIDKLLADHPRLQVAWDALQELYGLYLAEDYDGALAALGRFADLYATGKLPEYQQSRRHRHRLGRRNPGLASVRATIQRPTRGSQQPPPSPTKSRPRLHQPEQLRSPRTPPNMTPHRQQHPFNPTKTRRAQKSRSQHGQRQLSHKPEIGPLVDQRLLVGCRAWEQGIVTRMLRAGCTRKGLSSGTLAGSWA